MMRPDTHGPRAKRCYQRARWLRATPRLGATLLALLGGSAFALDAGAAEAELAWDLVADVDGYKVYYDLDSGAPYEGTDATEGASPIDVPIGSLSDPNLPTFTVTGLDSCAVYYFAVTAYNTAGESDYSGEVYATVLARPQPVVVTGAGVAAMEVSWPPLPSDDDGYIPRYYLHWDTASHADWEMPNDPPYNPPYVGNGSPLPVETTALDDPTAPAVVVTTGLEDMTTYYVRVQASCDGEGRSKFSEETSGMTGETGTGGSGTGGSGTGNSGTGGSGASGNSGSGGDGNSGTGATGAAPTGGTGPGASSGSGDSSNAEEEGCGCALPGRANEGGAAALGVGAVLALTGARRRRRLAGA